MICYHRYFVYIAIVFLFSMSLQAVSQSLQENITSLKNNPFIESRQFTKADISANLSSSASFDASSSATMDLKVMFYNVLNFSHVQNGCGGPSVPDRWDTLEKIVHYVVPDVLMICELETEGGADRILNFSLNSNGYTNYERANFVLDQSGGSNNLNNMFFYNSDKMTLYSQTEITTTTRDIGKYTVFLNDPNLPQTQDTTFIDFYIGHLKAGSDPTDMARRQTDCAMLKAYIDAQPNRNFVLAGDLNLYTSTEDAYQTLLGGTHPLNDPINTPGAWNTNWMFAQTHTQSTRTNTSLDCGATGGLDSRFDFILINDAIKNGTMDVNYVNNSYTPLGNGGNMYNDNINDSWNNSGVPFPILDALFYMSDHIPVVLDLTATLSSSPCPLNLVVDEPMIPSAVYSANLTIVGRGSVSSGENVVFSAGDCITLDTSFTVELGSTFDANIGGCSP